MAQIFCSPLRSCVFAIVDQIGPLTFPLNSQTNKPNMADTKETQPTNLAEEAPKKEAPKRKDAHLIEHDLATLDITKLNPLSPEVISRQATINIGM